MIVVEVEFPETARLVSALRRRTRLQSTTPIRVDRKLARGPAISSAHGDLVTRRIPAAARRAEYNVLLRQSDSGDDLFGRAAPELLVESRGGGASRESEFQQKSIKQDRKQKQEQSRSH